MIDTTSADDHAIQVLSDEGAQCGVCGDQPGDRICPDCERCRGWYVAALRKAGWAPTAEIQQQLDQAIAELAALKKQITEAIYLAAGPAVDGIFQPGHTYALHYAQFRCEHLTTDPQTGRLLAWGWSTHNVTISNPLWGHRAMTGRDYTRWITDGATDLGPTELAGEPHR